MLELALKLELNFELEGHNLPIRAHWKVLSFCLLDLELRKSAQFCVFRALALASRDFSVLESVSHVSQAGSLFVAAPKSKIQVDSVEFELILFSTGKNN